MSPATQMTVRKPAASDNVYTIILALACLTILLTVGFVAYKCYFEYGSLFKIP
jgi:hypothetical protein